jgi:hypothetical protein
MYAILYPHGFLATGLSASELATQLPILDNFTMLKPIAELIATYLNGSYGLAGRAQGAVAALALTLGCFKLCSIGVAVDLFFWRQFIRPAKNLKNYGSWAAVTGATDGIGRAYCDELAKQGVHCRLAAPPSLTILILNASAAERIFLRV